MKPEIRKDWLNRAKQHAAADRFIKGQWLNGMVGDYKSGCFFGCMTQSEDNTLELASEQMNSPEWIVRLAERIFEGLPDQDSERFPVEYLEAIPDSISDGQYEEMRHKLGALRMQRMYDLVSSIQTKEDYKAECLSAIGLVLDYHREPLESARSAAWSAVESAWSAVESAWSAAESAESAAWSAAWSEARSAESAAESAESARSAASNEYINERNDLFSVFAEYK